MALGVWEFPGVILLLCSHSLPALLRITPKFFREQWKMVHCHAELGRTSQKNLMRQSGFLDLHAQNASRNL